MHAKTLHECVQIIPFGMFCFYISLSCTHHRLDLFSSSASNDDVLAYVLQDVTHLHAIISSFEFPLTFRSFFSVSDVLYVVFFSGVGTI